ncbi:uncharacterized protein TNCV_3519391 [Trichonephila clavipes]|uniref:Uncharacterized protein n=1 Tax=Trichonephila clavipes TaxID=2585209 RepID=A0A8X6VLH9_TRICX|nr:uncharacterized protein TNCV_3519391 [Trichonephila clavipes]
MPKSNTQRGKEFHERKKREKLAASPVEKVTKKQKNNANSSSPTCQISIRVHERISWMKKKSLQNALLMPSLRDGNTIETLLMTAQNNTDFVNHPAPSTTEPSTSKARVGTDACESIINSILRYKDYDFHKNACPRSPSGQRIRSWLACHEFESSTT